MVPLYGEFFGLNLQPFSVSPDPSFLYRGPNHSEALAQLVYGIKARRGFVVLTGEVGTGKTTLIHSLLQQLADGHTHVAFIFSLIDNPKDLLRSVCEDLGLISLADGQKDMHDYLAALNRFLLESYRKGDNVALIIDEAQNLSPEVLESVRLLSNFETSQDKVLQIVLVGQPELGARLNSPELRQLKQRVALRFYLTPLSLDECKQYIAKRLEVAGGGASIFPPKTVEAVHAFSGGIPRLINILCDNGMLTAYALDKRSVDVAMIEEVAHDLNLTAAPKRSVVASEATIPIKPKEVSRWPIEENSELADLAAALQRPAGLNAGQFFTEPAPNGAVATGEASKRADSAPHAAPLNSVSRAGESRPGAVPSRSFDRMISALTEAMGPMAPLVLREQIAAMGESLKTFPKQRLGHLVDAASREILSESLKVRFRALMSEEIRAIHPGKEDK